MTQSPPQEVVGNLITAHVIARCVHMVADVGVADALGDRTATAAELAAVTGLNADALGRVLRLLSTHGVFAAQAGGYVHTPASLLLRTDHPQSMRSVARMIGLSVFWNDVTDLRHAMTTGKAALDMAGLWAYFSAHPEEAQIFNRSMTDLTRTIGPMVADAYDFSSFGTVADIGGGRGHVVQAILDRHPVVTGICFDLPHVVADAEASGAASTRLRFHGGDFFRDSLPVADSYVIKQVLHDWADDDAVRILSAIRRAAPPKARLLLVEQILPDEPQPHPAILLDVMMLAFGDGRERTSSQYAELLEAADFRFERIIPTPSPCSIVEAVVA
jgi:hypothetical protein